MSASPNIFIISLGWRLLWLKARIKSFVASLTSDSLCENPFAVSSKNVWKVLTKSLSMLLKHTCYKCKYSFTGDCFVSEFFNELSQELEPISNTSTRFFFLI